MTAKERVATLKRRMAKTEQEYQNAMSRHEQALERIQKDCRHKYYKWKVSYISPYIKMRCRICGFMRIQEQKFCR